MGMDSIQTFGTYLKAKRGVSPLAVAYFYFATNEDIDIAQRQEPKVLETKCKIIAHQFGRSMRSGFSKLRGEVT
jgi:hypothetical protein